MPVGYASQTGYQYDSISRVAGQREPAPPSKFSKEGGFKNSVFKGIIVILYFNTPGTALTLIRRYYSGTSLCLSKAWKSLSKCALAGAKAQKNYAERRFGTFRRENRGPAGYRLSARAIISKPRPVKRRRATPTFPDPRWRAAGLTGPADTQNRHPGKADSAPPPAHVRRLTHATSRSWRRPASGPLRDRPEQVDTPVARPRGPLQVARRCAAV